MQKKRKLLLLITLMALLIAFISWVIWDNGRITVTEYTVSDSEIPESFNGYRIVQVSDLHNAEFGKDNILLLGMIKELQPDIILLTGDLIDSYHTNVDISLRFVQQVVDIAPAYYVTGNHEVRIPEDYQRLKTGMEAAGVTVLDSAVTLERNSETVTLLGVPDPSATGLHPEFYTQITDRLLEEKVTGDMCYRILLCHRPEVFEAFEDNGIDLAFSGHTHGGQIRLPLIGALFSPDQGLFPQYDMGIFTEEDTTMIISRGLGNSSFPFRVNCPPEIVAVTLIHE